MIKSKFILILSICASLSLTGCTQSQTSSTAGSIEDLNVDAIPSVQELFTSPENNFNNSNINGPQDLIATRKELYYDALSLITSTKKDVYYSAKDKFSLEYYSGLYINTYTDKPASRVIYRTSGNILFHIIYDPFNFLAVASNKTLDELKNAIREWDKITLPVISEEEFYIDGVKITKMVKTPQRADKGFERTFYLFESAQDGVIIVFDVSSDASYAFQTDMINSLKFDR